MTESQPIVIDGVIFQMQNRRPHGISRLWHSLLHELSKSTRGKDFLLLDRDGTAPDIPGVRARRIPPFSLRDIDAQAALLDEICREEAASLFVSTYYSVTRQTPSVLMLYDMILELLFAPAGAQPPHLEGLVKQLELIAKKMAIRHACAYMAISRSTADDLVRLYPQEARKPVAVVPCAAADVFRVNSAEEVAVFCREHGVQTALFPYRGSAGDV